MSLGYSAHYTEPLLPLANTPLPACEQDLHAEELYRQIEQALKPPFTPGAIQNALKLLQDDSLSETSSDGQSQHSSEALLQAALSRITFGLYANSLDLYLNEASAAQDEAEWWADIEQSYQFAALYLLQTLPKRILSLLHVLRSSDGSLPLSTFHPSSLRVRFTTRGRLQSSVFVSTLFPHLKGNPSGAFVHIPFGSARASATTIVSALRTTIQRLIHGLRLAIYYPLRLSRDECRFKREENERIRNESSEVLGKLIGMRPNLMRALAVRHEASSTEGVPNVEFFSAFTTALASATSVELSEKNVLSDFVELSKAIFITHKQEHAAYLDEHDLRRPSRLTRLWPRLVLLPPLTLYCVKTLYASRATLTDMVMDAFEVMHNLVTDWILEPLHGVFRTIRAGGDEGVIVRREAVVADLNSLERMAVALAHDRLGYNQSQLDALSQQIRLGDFTPILEIYEDDIKQPLTSALTGTLFRTLFVQVQKAKVDIDQALAGIDKLLKSQELTFAFVGVAPALAIVYVVGGFFRRLIFSGGTKHGGRRRKMSVWLAMRRIERLLLFQPKTSHRHETHRHALQPSETDSSSNAIPSLTTGLLVLSLTHLRNYALSSLPPRSRLREGFLEDVQDLEDPSLGRWEKLKVLDRMWNSWGRELGWYEVAGRPRGG